jgi:uncharacterized protein (TIGR03435 family)
MVGCYFPGSRLDVVPKGMCIARNASLRNIIAEAYGISIFNIVNFLIGGPGWIGSDRFDIQGKAEDLSATTDQLRAMLRNLEMVGSFDWLMPAALQYVNACETAQESADDVRP